MGVFDDAVFYWLPGDAMVASSDSVSATSASGTLTEGTATTVSGKPGRVYSGTVGSRFGVTVASPQIGDVSAAVAVRRGTGGSTCLFVGDGSKPDYYFRLNFTPSDLTADYRYTGGGAGGAGWAAVTDTWAGDDDLHVLIATCSLSGADITLTYYLDGVSVGTDTQTMNVTPWTMSRVTVGRLDDSSPNNSSGIKVFRAYVWDKVLSSGEIAAVTADPFDEAAAPDAPTNPAASALGSTSIRVTWDDVTDETGYRVERSPNGTTGWADVSGNLAADATQYDDTGLTASTTYYYRVYAFNGTGDSAPSTVVNATTDGAGGNRMGGDRAIRRSPR